MPRSDLPFGSEFSPAQIELRVLLELAYQHGANTVWWIPRVHGPQQAVAAFLNRGPETPVADCPKTAGRNALSNRMTPRPTSHRRPNPGLANNTSLPRPVVDQNDQHSEAESYDA